MVNRRKNAARRAGHYERQPTGYRAFMPAELPPDPPIQLGGELQALLSRADRALGRLDGAVSTLPSPDLFVFMYVRKEAVLSSQIEGTQSSLQDLLVAEAAIRDSDTPRDVDEVLNYVRAMNVGLQRLNALPVSVRLIRDIHKTLMEGVRGGRLEPGELRRTQNWIGAGGITLGEASFVPPPPHVVPEALSHLERFLHSEDEMPILVKVGLAHAQFETIHPFLDGNGRVGRLLITFLLTEREILLRPVLYLSHYFKRYRQTYYDRLQAVRDTGDWEGWLEFFLQGIAEVANEAADTARRILEMREHYRQTITDGLGRGAANGHRVFEFLFDRPIINVKQVADLLDVTPAAANNIVHRLEGLGVLREYTGFARNRRYRFEPYLRLFEEAHLE